MRKIFAVLVLALGAILVAPGARADLINPPPLTVSCVPPLLWHTTRCECPDGTLPVYTMYGTALCSAVPLTQPACRITITFPVNDPGQPTLAVDPRCDDWSHNLALAQALARRLGAP